MALEVTVTCIIRRLARVFTCVMFASICFGNLEFSLCFQDNFMEGAFKMRNLLEEFSQTHHGLHKPTILGVREHVFTGRFVSSNANFLM